MQIKTIKKTIIKKMEDWLSTITDEELRKKVKENLLVTGGSITSMLLNEPVNDFDVYIKNEQALFDLVRYYTAPFKLEIMRGNDRELLVGQMKDNYGADSEDEIQNRRIIAIRNLKPNQVKIFVTAGMRVNEDKKPEELNYSPVFFSPNAVSLSNDVQIVCRFSGDSDQIHTTFDFIHATNYFTFEEGLVTNKEALECILTKQLKYQGSLYPLTTIIRIKKFLKRGWNINAGEMLKVMFQISELDLKDPDVLEDQLVGVDIAYFGKLIEVLRGVPSNTLTSQYLNTIIDRVFNEYEEEEETQK